MTRVGVTEALFPSFSISYLFCFGRSKTCQITFIFGTLDVVTPARYEYDKQM